MVRRTLQVIGNEMISTDVKASQITKTISDLILFTTFSNKKTISQA